MIGFFEDGVVFEMVSIEMSDRKIIISRIIDNWKNGLIEMNFLFEY